MYYCKLVRDGIVLESFYRNGSSAAEVLDGFMVFCWPDGDWIVEEC